MDRQNCHWVTLKVMKIAWYKINEQTQSTAIYDNIKLHFFSTNV